MLWTRDYKLSTVHVYDVVRAIWHLCYHGNAGDVYNLADKGDTSMSFASFATILLFMVKRGKGKGRALPGSPISELRDVTCHMGSHSVTSTRHK